MSAMRVTTVAVTAFFFSIGAPCAGTPEVLLSPYHQSPVGGDPGDLLSISGAGFETGAKVVYVRGAGTPPSVPPSIPPANSPDAGFLDVIEAATRPDGITVRLAKEMIKDFDLRTMGEKLR